MNKTEIISFIIDEAFTRVWNISSNTRKRVQMVLKYIRIQEYNEKPLKHNNWLIIERNNSIESIEDVKKGVSDYYFESREQLDKFASLNTKLRCKGINFEYKIPLNFDCIQHLALKPSS